MGKGVTIDKLGGFSLEDPHSYISFEEYAGQEASTPIFSEGAEEIMALEDLDFDLLTMSAKLTLSSPPEAESAESLIQIEANPSTRIDDPVKMYLKDMGTVSLLTREGEIEIAMRIQEGSKEMILALLETPFGVKTILDLANHLDQEKHSQFEESTDFFEEEDIEQPIPQDHWGQLILEACNLGKHMKRVQTCLLKENLPEEKRLWLEARLERNHDEMIQILKNIKIPPLHLVKIVRKINDYGYLVRACRKQMADCLKKAQLREVDFRRLSRAAEEQKIDGGGLLRRGDEVGGDMAPGSEAVEKNRTGNRSDDEFPA